VISATCGARARLMKCRNEADRWIALSYADSARRSQLPRCHALGRVQSAIGPTGEHEATLTFELILTDMAFKMRVKQDTLV
jgi:hypothetical protein